MIAYCGLNCGECEIFLATQKNDDRARADTARTWSEHFGWKLAPEDINCDGCLQTQGKLFKFCSNCQVRDCCSERELSTCAQCDDYLCEKLEGMIKIIPEIGKCLEGIRRGT